MTDREVDEILETASRRSGEVQPALLERIAGSIKPSLRPVRPLPTTWKLVAGLILICAAVAITGAARAGFYGVEKLGPIDRVLIFSALTALVAAAGVEFVSQMIPGTRLRITSVALLEFTCAALLGVFAVLFRDYRTEHFLSAGVVCLLTGLLHAIPAALLGWWLLRRGFAVNPITAALVAGILGGLAGVTMLELHCPNFEATHVLVWHTAVVPLSGAIGAMIAWGLHFRAGRDAR